MFCVVATRRKTVPVAKGAHSIKPFKTFYDEQPSTAERMINVGFPSPNECDLLACPPSQPVYGIEKLVTTQNKNLISFSALIAPSPHGRSEPQPRNRPP
jgi:GntR family transcriptional regulator, frlABCD operon transcriptional regulator